jgi:leucyl-tRNA synthetase
VEPIIAILAPFAPHIAEELWDHLGHEESIFEGSNWPSYDESKIVEDTVNVAVQVNGKLRGTITVSQSTAEEDVIIAARAEENVARYLDEAEERRVIHVPGRLVNFVIG